MSPVLATAFISVSLVQKLSNMAPLLRLELLPWQEDSFDQLLGGKQIWFSALSRRLHLFGSRDSSPNPSFAWLPRSTLSKEKCSLSGNTLRNRTSRL